MVRLSRFAILMLLAVSARADDVDIVYARYKEGLIGGVGAPSESSAKATLSALKPDGTWPDVDLSLTEQVNWTPRTHLDRLAGLAKAWTTPGHSLAGDAAAAAKIGAALDAYLKADPESTNWWYNEIGAQLVMGPFMYIWRDKLTAAQKAGADSVMARSWRSKARTGQNLVWISRITSWRAAFNHDAALLDTAAKAIASTITISTSEGIQADFSFHQHGAQLYNGGYGQGYAADGASLAVDFAATRFAFSPAQIGILSGYLLEGQRWMVRGGILDHSVRGREITRSGSGSANSIGGAAGDLAIADPASAPALKALEASIASAKGSAVDGARWFWRSEYLAHHRAGHFISLRMASKRLQASEVVNNEGLLSTYIADGATLIYRTGHEYDGVFPVWNWSRIPGVTAADATTPAMKNPAPGNGSFAGGVSDGRYAAAAFEQDKLGVKAKKAWFLFDGQMTALGAGISATGTDPIRTSVNQCLLNGAVRAAGGVVIPPGTGLPAPAAWIHHDGIGYIFPGAPGAAKPVLNHGPATGNWKRINAYQSAATVNEDMFTLGLDHGAAPDGARYAYTIMPGADEQATANEAQDPDAVVLSHTPEILAVRHRKLGVTGAVFFSPGTLKVTPTLSLTPSRPCILLIREIPDALIISAADPARGAADLVLKANVKLTGQGASWSESEPATTITLRLPQGADSAGASVARMYSTNGSGIVARGKPGPGQSTQRRLQRMLGFGWRFARPSEPASDAIGRETIP